jgi:hypothetical protein
MVTAVAILANCAICASVNAQQRDSIDQKRLLGACVKAGAESRLC